HRKLALLAAAVQQAGDPTMRIRSYRPLLGPDDRLPVARAATLLALADEIEHRMPEDEPHGVRCEISGRKVVVHAPVFDPWRRDALAARFRRAFGRSLLIEPEEGGTDDA